MGCSSFSATSLLEQLYFSVLIVLLSDSAGSPKPLRKGNVLLRSLAARELHTATRAGGSCSAFVLTT